MPAPAPICRTFLAACLVVLAFAGCGGREEIDGLTGIAGGSLVEFTSRGDYVTFRHPDGWVAHNGRDPLVAQVGTGGALVSIYAYPRAGIPDAEEAREKLIRSLADRAPGFLVERTLIGEVDGAPSVEIRGRGTIAGKPVESRSLHVYKESVEWVIDAYARPSQFERANRVGFSAVFGSLQLSDSVESSASGEEG